MKNLFFKNKFLFYDKVMDKECIELCDAMNALPGIQTIESCCGHGNSPYRIYFRVAKDDDRGLFFLTRCVDMRYWKYGYLWKIELCVGDVFKDYRLPIIYILKSDPIIGLDAYKQAHSLVGNMNLHINNKNFMEGFDLDVTNFETEEIKLII